MRERIMIPKNQESEQVFGFFKVITTYTFIYISYFRVLYIYTKWSNLKEHYRRLQWWLLLQIRNNTLVLCRARKHTIAEITFAHTHTHTMYTCIYTRTQFGATANVSLSDFEYMVLFQSNVVRMLHFSLFVSFALCSNTPFHLPI